MLRNLDPTGSCDSQNWLKTIVVSEIWPKMYRRSAAQMVMKYIPTLEQSNPGNRPKVSKIDLFHLPLSYGSSLNPLDTTRIWESKTT
jgi:hypothetical protein